MQYKLVESNNLTLLNQILAKLQKKYPNHSTLTKNFYRSIPTNKDQHPFAIIRCQKSNEIKAIYQLIKQLKFTRGMQPVYHSQQLLNQVSQQQLNKFQRWLIQTLDGYKVLLLGGSSNKVFQPHQVYMETKNRPNL